MDQREHCLAEAQRRTREYGCEPGGLQWKWRTDPPAEFDQREATAAILDALNREGVVAWDGDGVSCVMQMLEALHKRWRGT